MAVKILTDRPSARTGGPGSARIEELSADARAELDRQSGSGGWHGDPVFEISYEGRVVAKRERNGAHDSDFYATAQDETGAFVEVFYASTASWTYWNSADIDATDEVKAAYAAHKAHEAAQRQTEREAAEAAVPRVGRTVKVVKGRKINVGTVAEVVWFGTDKYKSDRYHTAYRVGLIINGAREFTSADNVEVVAQ